MSNFADSEYLKVVEAGDVITAFRMVVEAEKASGRYSGPEVPSGTFQLGRLPRGMKESLFNEYAVFVDGEATEASFYLNSVPTGQIDVADLQVTAISDKDMASYADLDIRQAPPIVIGDGKLLDGQHRIVDARAKGLTHLPYIDVSGLTDIAEAGFISDLPRQPAAIERVQGRLKSLSERFSESAIRDSDYLDAVSRGDADEVDRLLYDAAIEMVERWPKVEEGDVVSGLRVMKDIDNVSSIGASFGDDYTSHGVREVPISFFTVNPGEDRLAERIEESGEIMPLIIGVEAHADGPAYILEGAHRIHALKKRGVSTFPALVVIDTATAEAIRDEDGSLKLPSQVFDRVDWKVGEDEYQAAVAAGDLKSAQKMVEAEARASGFTRKVFHGSSHIHSSLHAECFVTEDHGEALDYAEMACYKSREDDMETLGEICEEAGADSITDLSLETLRIIAKDNGMAPLSMKGAVGSFMLRPGKTLDLKSMGGEVHDVGAAWEPLHEQGLLSGSWAEFDDDVKYELQEQYRGMAIYKLLENEGVYTNAFSMGFDSVEFADQGVSAKTAHTSIIFKDPDQIRFAAPVLKDCKGDVLSLQSRFPEPTPTLEGRHGGGSLALQAESLQL